MSFGFSVGDIVLCTQIAYRLVSSITTAGRHEASTDLRELQDVLWGLCFALSNLQVAYDTILTRPTNQFGYTTMMKLQMAYMINSCQETLEILVNSTADYRSAVNNSGAQSLNTHGNIMGIIFPRFGFRIRVQWRQVLWSFRGDSLSKYRQKLQSHTDSINILLNTFIWLVAVHLCILITSLTAFVNVRLATDRIEEHNRHQTRQLEDILRSSPRPNSVLDNEESQFDDASSLV
ncbi:hypothetical protein N7490_007521 [Penicillium lividum]|nr:hypothetical protein N7490_007521 [Penicillium lividum]